jgi:hypothetical protein
MPSDLVLRRVAGAHGAPLTARQLEARAEAWRPWRGYAVMHLWATANEQTPSRALGTRQRPSIVPFSRARTGTRSANIVATAEPTAPTNTRRSA